MNGKDPVSNIADTSGARLLPALSFLTGRTYCLTNFRFSGLPDCEGSEIFTKAKVLGPAAVLVGAFFWVGGSLNLDAGPTGAAVPMGEEDVDSLWDVVDNARVGLRRFSTECRVVGICSAGSGIGLEEH